MLETLYVHSQRVPDFLRLPRYLSLGLVLPTYSENHIKANLSDQILQVQCKYPGIPSILHSLSLFPLFPPLSLSLSLSQVWPYALIQSFLPGLQHRHRECPSGVACPTPFPSPPISTLFDRQDHTWVPRLLYCPLFPPVFMLCCKMVMFFLHTGWRKK